ncbi:PopZ family protein [Methylopila musalis]|uniref:PopZ family protein n=1 Tax=Methylopila musalis TaxID=1134781 RepID=A0ABW3Z742_9HYPH
MSNTARAHEPTMEEILASIRRIISDDEPNAGARETTAVKSAEKLEPKASLGQDDIDAMLASFDEPAAPEPEKPELRRFDGPTRAGGRIELDHDVDVFELTDDMSAEPAPQVQDLAPPPPPPSSGQDRLLSQATDQAVSAAFGSLANTILSNNGRTIDDLVKEMLRPLLKSWLDDNLPSLVERLVRQEIERVARGGR